MEFKKLEFTPDGKVPNYYVAEVDLGAFKKEYRVFLSSRAGKWLVYEDYKDIYPVGDQIIENFEQGKALAQQLFDESCRKVISAMTTQ